MAKEWLAAWNARDLERVLRLYAEDCEMASNTARRLGHGEDGVVRGKAALRAYWTDALAAAPELHFKLRQLFLSPNSVTILYHASHGHDVVEYLSVDDAGLIRRSAAHHPPSR